MATKAPGIRGTRLGSFIAVALSGALILAACGGGDDDSDKSASPAGAPKTEQPAPAGQPAAPAPAQDQAQAPAPSAAPTPAAPSASPTPSAAPTPQKSGAAAPRPKASTAPAAPKPAAAPKPSGGSAAPTPAAPTPKAPGGAAPAPAQPAPGGPLGASDRGVSATEIKLGSIQMHGMPLGNLLVDPQVRGNLATARAINDAGGILGRKMTYIDCDDGPGETSRAKACFKKLVEQDKIFGLVTSISWSTAAITQELAAAQTPFFGAWAYSYVEWTEPWSFGAHMSMLNEANAGAEWVRDVVKPKTFGLICLNAPEMQRACGNVYRVLNNAGAKLVKKIDVTLTPGDLSAEVIAMRSANPDHIVHYVINPASIAKFVVDSAQQQYWPPKGMSGNHLGAELLGEIFGDWPTNRYWTNTTYQLWGPEYMATMKKYAPNNKGLNHHIVQAGHVAINILAQAMKEAGPELTRQKVMQILATPGRAWDAGPGLGQKWMWAPGERMKDGTGSRKEYMYKYTSANTVAKEDSTPNGFVPDPDKFVITDTQNCCYGDEFIQGPPKA